VLSSPLEWKDHDVLEALPGAEMEKTEENEEEERGSKELELSFALPFFKKKNSLPLRRRRRRPTPLRKKKTSPPSFSRVSLLLLSPRSPLPRPRAGQLSLLTFAQVVSNASFFRSR